MIAKLNYLAKQVEPLLKASQEILSDLKSSKSDIEEVENSVKAMNIKIKELEVYEAEVPTAIRFIMTEVKENVLNFDTGFKGKSIVAMNYYKIEISKCFIQTINIIENTLGKEFIYWLKI